MGIRVTVQDPNGVAFLPPVKTQIGKVVVICFIAGTAIAALGLFLGPICWPIALALKCSAAWIFWTASIVLINQFTHVKIQQLHAKTMEINSTVVCSWIFPLTFFSRYLAPQGSTNKTMHVVLVNGYLSFAATWHYLRNHLVEAGYQVHVINMGSFDTIETYAEQVRARVNAIQAETGLKDYALIGHSKGGIVSAEHATRLSPEERIHLRAVITIGSPLSGTPVASFGLGADARQMEEGSPFLAALQEKIRGSTIPFFCIGSTVDDIVPISSSLPAGINASRQRTFTDIGHLGLLFYSKTAAQLSHWLQSVQK